MVRDGPTFFIYFEIVCKEESALLKVAEGVISRVTAAIRCKAYIFLGDSLSCDGIGCHHFPAGSDPTKNSSFLGQSFANEQYAKRPS